MRYGVGYVFSDEDIKDLSYFNTEQEAVINYLDRLKNDYIKLNSISKSLKVIVFDNSNKLVSQSYLRPSGDIIV